MKQPHYAISMSAWDAWMLLTGQTDSIILHKTTQRTGPIVLASRPLLDSEIERYRQQWEDSGRQGKHPVDWAAEAFWSGCVFAYAELVSVTRRGREVLVAFRDIVPIAPVRVKPLPPVWWWYDEENHCQTNPYDLDDERIRLFYDLCLKIERGENVSGHEMIQMLSKDPRARYLRRGIINHIFIDGKWLWRAIRVPNWRSVFRKRFGEQYVPKLSNGQSYAHLTEGE